MDEAAFKSISRQWLSGVAVVTTARDGRAFGTTVSATVPLSLSPARFLVCLSARSETLGAVKARGGFCINILSAEQAHLAATFARKGADKFSQAPYRLTSAGLPALSGAIAHVECTLNAALAAGDHEIVIGDATAGHAGGGEPLAYFGSALLRPAFTTFATAS